jgi:hypothetical protein
MIEPSQRDTHMSKMVQAALMAAALAVSGPAIAQPAPPATVLDAGARQDIVAKLADGLRQRYVFPDVGIRLADTIMANQKSGAYDSLSDPAAFARRLDSDLAAIAHDKHLHVFAQGAPPAGGRPPEIRNEAGVVRADRLPGGIGYVEVIGFPPLDAFRPAIDRAMQSLAGSKALIIDDRRNHGGDPASVGYLVSFLAPPGKPMHINDIVSRKAGTESFSTQAFDSQPTPVNYAGAPAYVLTSSETISGGEELAYDLQTHKLATVVGEVTAGGANPTSSMPLPSSLVALIPFGRAENPITKTNWEGGGVKPDVPVPAPQAFRTALQRLGGPAATEIAAVSEKQVFAPRNAPLAGTEAALRHMLQTIASGAPDYSDMTPQFAEAARPQEARVKALLSGFGELRSIAFRGPAANGGDDFDVTFATATWRFTILLTAEGKVAGIGILGPASAAPPSDR